MLNNIIQNVKNRPKLGRSCRSILILGHDYESVVDCVLFESIILDEMNANEKLLSKKFFDQMHSLDFNEINIL